MRRQGSLLVATATGPGAQSITGNPHRKFHKQIDSAPQAAVMGAMNTTSRW